MKETTLNLMKIGDTGFINSINDDCKLKRRMLEIGFTKHTEISAITKSLAGDPTAYLIKGTVVALRNSDAQMINVSLK